MEGKIIVISAPSGCGKSTIINRLFDGGDLDMRFSVSATNRQPREGERNGEHYHFLSTEEFRDAIADGRFIEWEEVYPGRYYGTLRSEIDNAVEKGENVILDIDVNGGINVKKLYGDRATTIFVQPPSVGELRRRLESRGTDSPEVIDQRVARAEYEISKAPQFDHAVVNDDLEQAVGQTHDIIANALA
ncbi:MAG: guanylate kinase [Muribaculaceae bacterium]|nr:guanylate kinase [Muribaculaceae bacterium]